MTVAGKRYVDCTVLATTADAEDSSYDSDYETEELNHTQLELQVSSTHSNVSRTTSDTLAAEFAEYVTVRTPSPTRTPGYTARLEFALKLGYTEPLVQSALQKLGPDPGQNELLAELIKLGASQTQRPPDTDVVTNGVSATALRAVVIDGSNVAMSHGNKEVFSCRGIKICVDWFKARGHNEITVFVPKWRKEASRIDNPIADQEILGELERDRLLVFTPSRLVGGKRMVCYDDRYILRLASELDGIVVSNDNYRDLAQENPEFRKVVQERILMYSFVNDRFMPPDDPLGRSGPTLENFLKRSADPAPPCPYAKKCTYGNKCKFRHPERGPHPQKSVSERLVEHAQKHMQARAPTLSLPLPGALNSSIVTHAPLCKARSNCEQSSTVSMVTKSKSAENVTLEYANNSGAYNVITASSSQGYRSSRQARSNPESESTLNSNANTNSNPPNTHRKLQRQLTLNPTSDPRLNQLRRHYGQNGGGGHKPLTRRASGESHATGSWESQRHQNVTRIASAPESFSAWPPVSATVPITPITPNMSLAVSEPQLPYGTLTRLMDERSRIHYHLASIFPEARVRAAMAANPFETDAERICAEVLRMYRN